MEQKTQSQTEIRLPEGPCYYCGKLTTLTAAVPPWGGAGPEEIWVCDSEECNEALAVDAQNNDWEECLAYFEA